MRMRREMPSTLFASPEHRALSKRIRKLVRRDLRCSNTRAIQAAIEQNRGSKVFLKPLGRSHLAKVRTADGRELTSHSEILAEVERFYGRLYSSRAERPSVQGANDPRAPLTRHYTEDIPEVDIGEIRTALGQLKNGRAPGDDDYCKLMKRKVSVRIVAGRDPSSMPTPMRNRRINTYKYGNDTRRWGAITLQQ
ncbi:hypothetical protein K1T71_001095 [Dendrolimus kikuchii]|uniref:Uncharacterized protein n=1 Tax=Dendrolimus kikuchii TaxID=765133 RepID=A0ACC1DGN3_9NEOP|nr:hypothetical protein K1T71_001095 [Dendrolimus kikuchii]